MTIEQIAPLVGELAIMRYFPGDIDARLAVAKQIACIAADVHQARWLVTRALELYAEWPGVHELRALYCSRYRPLDGKEVASVVYLDGIPPDPQIAALQQIAEARKLQIAGETTASLPAFPTDSLGLIAEAVHRARARIPLRTEAKAASDAEIERIKAIQECNRTELPRKAEVA